MKLKNAWIWTLLAVAIVAGIWAVPRYVIDAGRTGDSSIVNAASAAGDAPGEALNLERDAAGRRVFALGHDVQERIDLSTSPLVASEYLPHVTAFGRVVENPGSTFTLRSPIAGYLEQRDGDSWPRVGDAVSTHVELGSIKPRLTTVERFDLNSRLMQVRADVDEFTARLAAAQSSYEHKKSLNEGQKVVTDREIEAALANVKTEAARLAAAEQTLRLLTDTLAGNGNSANDIRLVSQRNGNVIDVYAQPGESVEAGQALLKILDSRQQLASVAVATGTVVDEMPIGANIRVVGLESRIFPGAIRSAVPAGAAGSNGQMFLVSFETADAPIRPGMLVQATLELQGTPVKGVIVPRGAVVRVGGAAYVYQQTGDGQFTRIQIDTDVPVEAGWFVSAGLSAGDRVVVVGAGTLLSEELRSQIEAEAEGDE
ncbi:MAG: hypothetical protein H6819_09475 [Phycisphaerales bacterium]|nr:hypothetical protein [Phycisphaerales bacterium]MCB9855419.1 hypothetical protein [Phycisphaerales bacterium]